MLNSLRGRFILSHILPLLIVIPLMGMATIYLIEQRILVPSLLAELRGDVLQLSHLAAQDPELFKDPAYTQKIVTEGSLRKNGRVMFLDSTGKLLSSSDPADAGLVGTIIDLPDLNAALQGQVSVKLRYSQYLHDDIADALAPVKDAGGQTLGFVRLSYLYYTFTEQIYQLRYLLTGILLVSLLLGAILGTALAINVAAPVEKVTRAVYALANGEGNEALPETGPDEMRRLARSVNTLVERLRSLETARKRLLANLVHEIGRPLGALRMGIEALSHGANLNPEFYTELLGGMDQETARLQRLLGDLAHLYDQALGALELDRQSIDLAAWLPKTLSPWQQVALQKPLQWTLAVPEGLPTFQADPLRLAQVVGNLVSNAIKFTPAGGAVTITAGAEERQVWLRVKDTGPGIPPELQDTLFEPFVRGGHGRRFLQGMGLGLTIARELAEAHGGKLSVESRPGSGAAFTLWLPLYPQPVA